MRRRPGQLPERLADGRDAAADPGRIRAAAMGLLARREHSTPELRRKLEARGFDADVTGAVLDDLASRRLLSDERYVTSFIVHHAARGQGPVRIRAELKSSGVAPELIGSLLDQADVDWVAAARAVRRKKFAGREPAGFAERAKQARFLQYRGFSEDQIRASFSPGAGGDDPEYAADPGLDD